MATASIDYGAPLDVCPVCNVSGLQPCVAEDGRTEDDHDGRGVAAVT